VLPSWPHFLNQHVHVLFQSGGRMEEEPSEQQIPLLRGLEFSNYLNLKQNDTPAPSKYRRAIGPSTLGILLCPAASRKPLKGPVLRLRSLWKSICNERKVRDRSSSKGLKLMPIHEIKKCAHIPCLCDVPDGEEFCGEACRDAGSEDIEIACQCDHPACPLTFRRFAPPSAADLVS